MKNIIIVAGGIWQKFIIELLKQEGYFVYIVNPTETETVKMADKWIKADVLNVDYIIKIIKKRKINPEFIISDQSEVAVIPVAKISHALGLKSNSLESLELFTNKEKMYNFAISLGIPVPKFIKTNDPKEALSFSKNMTIVVKPKNATSSRGFSKLENPNLDDMSKAIDKALKFSSEAIIQKFVEGSECCLEGFCQTKTHKSMAFCIKTHFRPGIASSLRYGPNLIPNELEEEIKKSNNKFVQNAKLDFGITHAEYMVDIKNKKFWLIEIAARGGGCGISSNIIPYVSGVDVQKQLLECIKGNPQEINQIQNNEAILQFYEFPNGIQPIEKLRKINNSIGEIKNVNYWHFNFNENEYLKPATTDQNRHALAIIHGNVDKTLQKIESILT